MSHLRRRTIHPKIIASNRDSIITDDYLFTYWLNGTTFSYNLDYITGAKLDHFFFMFPPSGDFPLGQNRMNAGTATIYTNPQSLGCSGLTSGLDMIHAFAPQGEPEKTVCNLYIRDQLPTSQGTQYKFLESPWYYETPSSNVLTAQGWLNLKQEVEAYRADTPDEIDMDYVCGQSWADI